MEDSQKLGKQAYKIAQDLQDDIDQNTKSISSLKQSLHTHQNKDVLDNTTASFTLEEKTKLSSIEDNAEENVFVDWNEQNISSKSFIKNKPQIPVNTGDLNNNSGFITSNDLPTDYVSFNSQSLNSTQKAQARSNIGAGTSNFNGNYYDIIAKPEVLTCQTTESTAAKVANADSYTTPPQKGVFYIITFTNGNSVTSGLTLSLGSTPYSLTGVGTIGSGGSVLVYFDGTEFKKFGLSDTPKFSVSTYTQKSGTSYLAKNFTMCVVFADSSISGSVSNISWLKAYISQNGSSWTQIGYTGSTSGYPKWESLSFVVPKGFYFKWEQTGFGSSGNNIVAKVYSLAN